ncbi:hypothetical protein SAY87_004801 [Trapa incisa]|uniref:DUF7906 domain-containing protein n=1 Tax=Trapa incisa TaxID=236973 RepID=A0AAN7JPF6_9MYRT|nr:hypothetical protein SAY87_004801 [Trapa incisa]
MASPSIKPLSLSFVLLLPFLLSAGTSAGPILGLDTFLSYQYRHDPQATNDSFLSLPSSLKSSLSHLHPSSPPSSSSLISSLLSLILSLPVHVRLVGAAFPSDSQTLLSAFLSAASLPSHHFHVISPFTSQSHRLSLSHSPHLDVSHAPSLASPLSESLKAEISKTPSALRSSLVSVPHSVVDEIVRLDFERQKPVEGLYMYFLDLGPQAKPYAYSYTPGDSSAGYTKCSGSIWIGKERYIWVDLGAGPVDYGPALSGDGVLPRGEFHPLAALQGRPKSHKALLADVASLVWSAYEVLVVPPLRIPVPFESSLIVQLVHIYSGESRDVDGLDWKNIEKVFMDEVNEGALLLGDQSLRFKPYSVSYKTCSICSFAISKSTNSYTSRFLFDNYTLIVSEYLDSKRLHQILSDSAEEFRRVADIPEEEDFGRSMWGVSPTHLTWSQRHNSTLVDYSWSVGQTPFGPFSEISTLSFSQKDAARRNVLLTSLNYSISSAIDVLGTVAAHGGERNLLKHSQYVEFVQRLSLFKYKLDKAVSALSHFDFELALYYLRSSDHDLYGVHSIVYHASQELEAALSCFKDPPFPWATISVYAVCVVAFIYVYRKREKLFRNKRKQF